MIDWLLRVLGVVTHLVVCRFCDRKVASKQVARAAGWIHTRAGWECNECRGQRG